MTGSAGSEPIAYVVAWCGVGCAALYYFALSLWFHRVGPRESQITLYEPPKVSPAMAGYLTEGEAGERAFAAAIASLASKDRLRIEEQRDHFALHARHEEDEGLPPKETAILRALLPGKESHYEFSPINASRLVVAFERFQSAMRDQAEPQLISGHRELWLGGVILSAVSMLWLLPVFTLPERARDWVDAADVIFWAGLGAFSLLAALRVWPVTIRRLISHLPGPHPARPLSGGDLIPVYLTGAAILGLGLLASLASPEFVRLLVAILILDSFGQKLLSAPTKVGRQLIAQLGGFREFLSRADADRLERENQPGQTPEELDRFSSYAIALGVKSAWEDEFAESVLAFVQAEQVYSFRDLTALFPDRPRRPGTGYPAGEFGDGIIQLKIPRRSTNRGAANPDIPADGSDAQRSGSIGAQKTEAKAARGPKASE